MLATTRLRMGTAVLLLLRLLLLPLLPSHQQTRLRTLKLVTLWNVMGI